jgi:hypothetical protein
MTKIVSKQKRITDIVSMLEQGMERKAILQKLAKSCKVSARTLDNEIKEAKNIVSERNKQREEVRLTTTAETIKEAVKGALLSDLELEAILCKIAAGKMEVEQVFGENVILREVTPSEMVNAIDKLFKKRGSNAPTKNETNITGVIKVGYGSKE